MGRLRGLATAGALGAALGVTACATAPETNGDPGAIAMPSGYSCQSVRQELNTLDRQGVPAKVEAATAGKKLQPQAKAQVDRYNELLNIYLGARCHV